MKVMFFVTGIGYGDVIRQEAIIKELNEDVLVATYHKGYEYFKGKHKTVKIHSYKVPDRSFKLKPFLFFLENLLSLPVFLFDLVRMYFIVKKFNPDVIVSDLEPLAIPISKMLGKRLITIFGVEDEVLRSFKVKNIFLKMQKWYLEKMYSYGELIVPSLIGKDVNPIVRGNVSEKNLMEKLKLDKKPILIMLGGSRFGINVADEMLEVLDEIDEDFIIFGYKNNFEKGNVKCYKFKENFLEYLKVCKGVITLGGHSTLSEIVVYKKPSLIFPIQNHLEQKINGYVMNKNGLGMVKNLKKFDSEMLKKYILEFLEKDDDFEEKLRKLDVKGDGAVEVVKRIKG